MSSLVWHIHKVYSGIILLGMFFCEYRVSAKPTSRDIIWKPSYISKLECDSLLRAVSVSTAVQSGVPERLARKRFPAFESKLRSRVIPRLIESERWVHATSSTQNNTRDTSSRRLFLRYAERAIRNAVNSMSGTEYLRFDRSDRITSFISNVIIQPDGWLHVCEVIRIYNGNGEQTDEEGVRKKVDNQIQRGIQREFPTKYIEPNGFLKKIPFMIDSITVNGMPELFQQVSAPNGVLVRIGNPTVYLDEGEYEYKLWYRTAEQLYYGKEYVELYWNVTGNGWRLRIDYAECIVSIPSGSTINLLRGYTGYAGDSTAHCSSVVESRQRAVFSTTKSLDSAQGLTVSVRCEKGTFIPPKREHQWLDFLQDNLILPVFVMGFLVMSVINYVLWYRYGRDPEGSAIHPQFEPPKGLSPAEVGFVHNKGYNDVLTTASLVDASVNGYIRIRVESEGIIFKHEVYYIEMLPKSNHQTTSYYSFGDESSLGTIGKIVSNSTNTGLMSFARTVKNTVESKYVIDTSGSVQQTGILQQNIGKSGWGIFLIICSIIGMLGYFAIFNNYAPVLLIITVAIVVTAIIQQAIFMKVIDAYTKQGRELADKILGFKMYLSATEQKIFNALMPPKKTLVLYEKYLPFAVALGVENEWSKQFEEILFATTKELSRTRLTTVSSFYSSSSSSFASSFGSAISSASHSSSSGGSSSGGASGGGGGGGGGGGW